MFVVQRHDARRLHYDLRLEMEGTLASWALPKGLPVQMGERYLAVHTEDHPMEYADFSGVIPKGQYGAGLMEIWDRGTYVLEERKRDGGLTVVLHGERLQGRWTLVPAHLDGEERNWLIIKKHDDEPREAAAASTDCCRCWPGGPSAARRRRLAVRGQVGRLPGARRGARQRGDAAQPHRRRPQRAASRPWPARSPMRCARPTAWSTARCARWTRRAGPASGCSSAAAARSSTTCSTCSSWSGGRWSTCRSSGGASSWRR